VSLFAAIGDTWRAYEAHRLSDAHETDDTTNTLTALPKLADVHRLFLAALATTAPAAAPGQSTGAAQLIANGFTE
jgi:hypothetical protein